MYTCSPTAPSGPHQLTDIAAPYAATSANPRLLYKRYMFTCHPLTGCFYELPHSSHSGPFRPGKIADFLGLLDHVLVHICTVNVKYSDWLVFLLSSKKNRTLYITYTTNFRSFESLKTLTFQYNLLYCCNTL
jgi:hypothetical protein